MPTSRATARSDSAADPWSASCRRAAARVSWVSSARTGARAPVAVVIHPSSTVSRAMARIESTALDTAGPVVDNAQVEARAVLSKREERSMGKHVIVGAGGVGAGVARELAAAGHDVVVV